MNEREKIKKEIIKKLKLKKSIIGVAARADLEAAQEEELIEICYDDAHFESFQLHLGRELFNEIVSYQVKFNNKPVVTFTDREN